MEFDSIVNILIIIGLILILIELNHNLKVISPLELTSKDWKKIKSKSLIKIEGWIEVYNKQKNMEIMIPEFNIFPRIMGINYSKDIKVSTLITPHHKDIDSREDNYWQAYIVKSGKSTLIKICIEIEDLSNNLLLENLNNIWLDIIWVNYGPFGRREKKDGILIPIKNNKLVEKEVTFIDRKNFKLLPIKTHLLGVLDDPIKICNEYTNGILKSGDIITLGETPLAIMQGRYRHPSSIMPGLVAKTLCRLFHPTSSLATACGLQSLIDIVGPSRIIFSCFFGAVLKIIGFKGYFYRFAGEQARLIDDITGTTPPYDQTIVLGPIFCDEICNKISTQLGVEVAIVDVNDLGHVKVLASSSNKIKTILKEALRSNPAGNSNEQTPLVLVRPS